MHQSSLFTFERPLFWGNRSIRWSLASFFDYALREIRPVLTNLLLLEVSFEGDRDRSIQHSISSEGVLSGENKAPLTFEGIYEHYFDFVFRSARRMGIRDSSIDDVVQDTFLVVYRRLADFEGRSSVRTWLFGIVYRVVSDHRRTKRRKGPGEELFEERVQDLAPDAHELLKKKQAAEILAHLLDELDEEKRAVFVLTELEEMSGQEIAEALSIPLNTVYSRLRVAREHFEKALQRYNQRTQRKEVTS